MEPMSVSDIGKALCVAQATRSSDLKSSSCDFESLIFLILYHSLEISLFMKCHTDQLHSDQWQVHWKGLLWVSESEPLMESLQFTPHKKTLYSSDWVTG